MSRLATDFSIANAAGAAVRTDLNNVLQDIATNRADPGAPTGTRYAGEMTIDWTANTLSIRNSGNTLDIPTVINPSTGLVGFAGLCNITHASTSGAYSYNSDGSWHDFPSMTVSPTPRNTNSRYLIVVQMAAAMDGGADEAAWKLLRDSTHIYKQTGGAFDTSGSIPNLSGKGLHSIVGVTLDSPGLDVQITYKVQVRANGTSGEYVHLNRHATDAPLGGRSSITAIEIAG
jgi:hypothetical protein